MAKANRSSLREKLLEEFLSCKICLEPFCRPKALPCLHSFCEHCLSDYVGRTPGQKPGHFPCPMCRKETLIPLGGVANFQDNFTLLSLSDTLDEDSLENSDLIYQKSALHPICPPSPREKHLRTFDWYFGKASRNASEEWLLAPGYPKGAYLIRQGEASPDTYTLSVRDNDEVKGCLIKHYKILTKQSSNVDSYVYYITVRRTFCSLPDLVHHYSEASDGLCFKLTQICAKPQSVLWAMERGKHDEFTTRKDTIHFIKKVGGGQFAEVWLGEWHGRDVAVKIQKQESVPMAAFIDEAQVLKTLQHQNIIRILGVCSEEPVFLLLEYMQHGRLSQYLREGKGKELGLTSLLWIGAQIADAMAYLEKETFLHRNLGARNILVDDHNKIKVAGFGMTRLIGDLDFNYRKGLKMAIKWMAPEVLLYYKYSHKADVWSFGIVLIEIFTHGKEPYEGMASKEAFDKVQTGFRIPKPQLCPLALYDVILTCWSTNPSLRPSFDYLNTFVHDFQNA